MTALNSWGTVERLLAVSQCMLAVWQVPAITAVAGVVLTVLAYTT